MFDSVVLLLLNLEAWVGGCVSLGQTRVSLPVLVRACVCVCSEEPVTCKTRLHVLLKVAFQVHPAHHKVCSIGSGHCCFFVIFLFLFFAPHIGNACQNVNRQDFK